MRQPAVIRAEGQGLAPQWLSAGPFSKGEDMTDPRARSCPSGRRPLDQHSTVLVTGGLGFVGRHLTQALARLDKRVIVADVAPHQGYAHPHAELRQVDLRSPEQAEQAVAGADLVFHLAGNSNGALSAENPHFDFESNAVATVNVAEAARRSGALSRFVYLSSAMVYGVTTNVPVREGDRLQPFLPYGASKLAGEVVLGAFQRLYGMPIVIARAFVIYGPGEDPSRAGAEVSQYLRWHLNGLPIRATGDLDVKRRDFIHIDDVVEALITIADAADDGDVLNVGTGQDVSLRQLADIIGTVTGRPPTLEADRSTMADSYRLLADVTRLRSLGFSTRVSLSEGISRLRRALGDQPELPSAATVLMPQQSARERTAA
jgi:UDP-glucose 4-epimerase